MIILSKGTVPNSKYFFKIAQEEAKKSTCLKRKCGAIVVKNNEIIGRGFNSPPGNIESQRRCRVDKSSLDKKVTDKTCCIHAEQRAILDVFKNTADFSDTTLYFTSINKKGERLISGKPYCTICSKFALEVGITRWVLEHKEGTVFYSAEEYNNISFSRK